MRELEIVVRLEALDVICHLRDGDGRVARHACRAQSREKEAVSVPGRAVERLQTLLEEGGNVKEREGSQRKASFSALSIVGGRSGWSLLLSDHFSLQADTMCVL